MADKTGIEWTDATWNPIAGCNDVSEGCRNCYARGMARRLEAMGSAKYAGLTVLQGSHVVWTGKIAFDEDALLQPLRWKRPRMIFTNSMSDLFHENVTDEMRDRIFAVMAVCPQHTFQVLTKRPERMRAYFASAAYANVQLRACDMVQEWITKNGGVEGLTRVFRNMSLSLSRNNHAVRADFEWPLPNVWLGVTVENQEAADERIPLLLQMPAAVRFLSCEPLLGAITLPLHTDCAIVSADGIDTVSGPDKIWRCSICKGFYKSVQDGAPGRERDVPAIDWVIVGGESGKGPGIRPMHPDWVRSLRDQSATAGVPFFFKQWGEFAEVDEVAADRAPERTWIVGAEPIAGTLHSTGGAYMQRVGKKSAGDLLDGVRHHAFPEVRA